MAETNREWWFLRHGECEGNVDGVLVPSDTSHLTAAGWSQAVFLRPRLAACVPAEVLVSPTARTIQTAIAMGVPPFRQRRLADLRERSFGALSSQTIAAVRAGPWSSTRAAWSVAPPDGETLHAVAQRAVAAVLPWAEGGGPVVVVAHAGVIRALVGLLDGLPTQDIGKLRVPWVEPQVRAVAASKWHALYDQLGVDTARAEMSSSLF